MNDAGQTPGAAIVMIGATGAVGGEAVRALAGMPEVRRLTLLGRRPLDGVATDKVAQRIVDVFAPASYAGLLAGHDTAICTLGVGQPTKTTREEYVRTDRDAVLAFAAACRKAGVRRFVLLGSVGADSRSRSFYLRTKGELEDGLKALGLERLSLFQPSMILTPVNRYGFTQAVTLAVWSRLAPLLAGPLRKFRGIPVAALGRAIARQAVTDGAGVETLQWDEITALADAG